MNDPAARNGVSRENFSIRCQQRGISNPAKQIIKSPKRSKNAGFYWISPFWITSSLGMNSFTHSLMRVFYNKKAPGNRSFFELTY